MWRKQRAHFVLGKFCSIVKFAENSWRNYLLYVVVDAHFLSKIRTTVKPLFTRFFDLTPYLISAHCHTDSVMSVNLSINQSVCLYLVSYPFILDGSRPNVRCKEKKKKWRKDLEMHFLMVVVCKASEVASFSFLITRLLFFLPLS